MTQNRQKDMATDINTVFRGLGRTAKSDFISDNIDYARARAIAEYAKHYFLDILDTFDEAGLKMVADYICEKGYAQKKQQ